MTFKSVEAGADAAAQRAALRTLIAQKPDVIVLLPHDGKELNAFGLEAMKAGIPVVNLDRAFPDALAYRLQIKGDNYGMGVAAGKYIGEQMKAKDISNPIIGEIAGIDSLELTQERSAGFKAALATYGFTVANRLPGGVHRGHRPARRRPQLLQALPKIDALWNHDDDQGIGVLAAITQANRSEFFMVGGAGSKAAIDAIAADNTRAEGDRHLQPLDGILGDLAGPPDRPGQGHVRPGRAAGARRRSLSPRRRSPRRTRARTASSGSDLRGGPPCPL